MHHTCSVANRILTHSAKKKHHKTHTIIGAVLHYKYYLCEKRFVAGKCTRIQCYHTVKFVKLFKLAKFYDFKYPIPIVQRKTMCTFVVCSECLRIKQTYACVSHGKTINRNRNGILSEFAQVA